MATRLKQVESGALGEETQGARRAAGSDGERELRLSLELESHGHYVAAFDFLRPCHPIVGLGVDLQDRRLDDPAAKLGELRILLWSDLEDLA